MLTPTMRSMVSRATLGVVGVALLFAAVQLVRAGRAVDRQNDRVRERVWAGGTSNTRREPPGGAILFLFAGGMGLLALPFLLAAVVPFAWYERLGRPPRMTLHENPSTDGVGPGSIGGFGTHFGDWP